jgi:hypothetical protein
MGLKILPMVAAESRETLMLSYALLPGLLGLILWLIWVEVPSVIGLSTEVAKTELSSKQLKYRITEYGVRCPPPVRGAGLGGTGSVVTAPISRQHCGQSAVRTCAAGMPRSFRVNQPRHLDEGELSESAENG